MISKDQEKAVIGNAVAVSFPELGFEKVVSRVDTGARNSAIWVSRAELVDGVLEVVFFDKTSSYFTGQVHRIMSHERIVVTNSTGHAEERFMIRLLVRVGTRKIRARFTLANRSQQVYPILIGRNILRGKFVVDVHKTVQLNKADLLRAKQLDVLQGREK